MMKHARCMAGISGITMVAAWCMTGVATAQVAARPWFAPATVDKQQAAQGKAREAIANARARQLIAAMTLDHKLQQLTGSTPELLPELPQCYGARHVTGIAALGIPTFRISNGPVGVGQNDCVSRDVYDAVVTGKDRFYSAYTHPSSAQATALPSGMAVAASFDPAVAQAFGEVIGTEMNNLALHVFEAPGVNLARLPVLGRNFEYFGEDPFLSGTMAVAETRAVQAHGIIAMAKHFIANEQETNRQTIQETVDEQVLRELYLLPFEMVVKDGDVGAIMCAYNYVNTVHSCENQAMLTGVLRDDWRFTGYVQTDFFAMKSTAAALSAGLDHEMPLPQYWAAPKLKAALDGGELSIAQIDTALERRFTQMFKAGIFDRPIRQTPIDFVANGRKARDIGIRSAVLLQNNGALPIVGTARDIVLVGKATQVYAQQAVAGGAILGKPMGAGGGSSDVVPNYSVTPADGLRAALRARGAGDARLRVVLVGDDNRTATIDGATVTFDAALAELARADAVVVMAGTISEEGADRATFAKENGRELAAAAAAGTSLDWYAGKSNVIATVGGTGPAANVAKSSGTVAMLKAILTATSANGVPMARKTALVLKDNAGVAIDPALVGPQGPSILEVWFPGQEDGNIVADLLLGRANPAGKLPVTFPFAGRGFMDAATPAQFPGVPGADGKTQTVTYSEHLNIGYRWYDTNKACTANAPANACVAFPFGYGLSYSTFATKAPRLTRDAATGGYRVRLDVTNTGKVRGAQVVQAYVTLPQSASAAGAPQPPKRLVGIAKIDLAPGASGTATIRIDPAASNHPLSVWSTAEHRWITPKGRYVVHVGTSSAAADLTVAGTFER